MSLACSYSKHIVHSIVCVYETATFSGIGPFMMNSVHWAATIDAIGQSCASPSKQTHCKSCDLNVILCRALRSQSIEYCSITLHHHSRVTEPEGRLPVNDGKRSQMHKCLCFAFVSCILPARWPLAPQSVQIPWPSTSERWSGGRRPVSIPRRLCPSRARTVVGSLF